MDDYKQTRFITIAIIVGIVLTLTAGIASLTIAHTQDVARDEYYATHCTKPGSGIDNNGLTYYKCGN